ncbi:ATP-binding protein [Kitasatospora sp. NBC_00240]|uniref:ATP-binding protein n=1 Tax=Kitasatospora sp. NBC_00240 TaxID=2903567 RepID=UPI00224CE22E|nr:ATP-binding protein [Kitasatospora sp. NBC_00240]MCX5215290.1 ATP-binding protein [Kitasatospora sp. NBC_00240]
MGTNLTTTVTTRPRGNQHPERGLRMAGTIRTAGLPHAKARGGAVFLAAEDSMVREARHCAAALLASWGVTASDRESAVLIIGELAANAAQYGGPELAVSLSLRGTILRIDVCDFGAGPSAPAARPAEEGGWGLVIVDRLADRVETTISEGRRTVRADLRLTPTGSRGEK